MRPWLARALELAQERLDARAHPAAGAIHELGRRALGTGIARMAERLLGRGYRVEIRQSARQPGGFDLLSSDVDLAFVIRAELTPPALARARKAHARLQRVIPWTGELEIYTEREWETRRELYADFAPLLDLIWLLRKWAWQEAARARARTGYHRRKAERSLARIREHLGVADAAGLPRAVSAMLARFGIPFAPPGDELEYDSDFSGFLEWRFARSDHPMAMPGALRLEPGLALAFAAVLPEGELHLPKARDLVFRARENPATSRAHVAVCAAEALLSSSHIRVYGPDEIIYGWIAKLVREVEARDPALAPALADAPRGPEARNG